MKAVLSRTPSSSEDEEERGDVEHWCTCDNCTNMDRHREKVCCTEMNACTERFDDGIIYHKQEQQYNCITEHCSFEALCLNRDVLTVAWHSYRQTYGQRAYQNQNEHKRFRHIAYRQLARFLFGVVGHINRYILPSCAVNRIREAFSAPENELYTGFRYADE